MLNLKLTLNIVLLISISIISGCSNKKNKFVIKRISYSQSKLDLIKKQFDPKDKIKTITIWVHGTKFSNILFKKVLSVPKLTNAINTDPNYRIHKIANILSNYDRTEYQFNSFYIFGWSGLLNWQEREISSQYLYKYLKNLIEEHKKTYGYVPKLNIITHSHGGNVALNLAKIKDSDDDLVIDKLILLACPVQKRTKDLIKNSNIFKNVYSFYSTLDALQVLDPQGFHKIDGAHIQPIKKKCSFFSKRRFDSFDNLRQAKIKINGRGILHSEFLMEPFLTILPTLIHEIDSYKKIDPDNKTHKDYLFSVNLM